MRPRATFSKRQREQSQKERQQDKAERRRLRRERKTAGEHATDEETEAASEMQNHAEDNITKGEQERGSAPLGRSLRVSEAANLLMPDAQGAEGQGGPCAVEIEGEELMSNKLFVGSLSWNTDDRALRAAFERFGVVGDVQVITDRETGQSRGFGFVSFSDPTDATAALEQMNGATLDGRTLVVNEARAKTSGAGGFAGDRPRGGSNRGSRDRW